MKKVEHLIKEVYPGSIAEELEIEPGDVLLSINDQSIEDVFDYRYMIKDEYIEVLIRKPDGEEWVLEIDKDYDDDLGIEFENQLMSDYKSCSNKCIFCFIDQMPPNMRETLYFKDDDSRLSFLQGNYITLTNMKEKDVDRIIKMQLAPINISVQTTNPELRCKMLNNRFAGEKLKFLDQLYEGHVEMNGQIVCCKGVNDGKELERTMDDLSKYLPFMRSVSVVPAGITKYRDNLYPLELFTKEEAGISRHSHACTQHRNIGQFLDSSCRNMRRHNLRTKSVYCSLENHGTDTHKTGHHTKRNPKYGHLLILSSLYLPFLPLWHKFPEPKKQVCHTQNSCNTLGNIGCMRRTAKSHGKCMYKKNIQKNVQNDCNCKA